MPERSKYEENVSLNIPSGKEHTTSIEEIDADFETAISATGFGKFNLLLLLIAVPCCWSQILATTTMSYVLPTARCDLNLNLQERGLLNAITYLGMITAAPFWGFLADTLGRKHLIVIGFLVDAIFGILAGMSQNYGMILFAKYMNGLIVSGPTSALVAAISEFHSAKFRARIILLLAVFYGSANLGLPMVAWLILPQSLDYEYFNGAYRLHSWNFFILVCALPSLISSIAYTFLPESPKFLMTVGRNEEALEVFKRVYSTNKGKPKDTYPIKSLINEVKINSGGKHGGSVTAHRTKTQALREGWQQITPLFFPPHLPKLALVCTIMFGFVSGLNTLRLWLPQIFTAMNDYNALHPNESASLCTMLQIITPSHNATVQPCVVNTVSSSVYKNAMIVGVSYIVGNFLAGLFINRLGKKLVLVVLGVTGGACGTSIYLAQNSQTTTALSATMAAVIEICTNVILTVVVDLFPTSLRTLTVSLTNMVGRTGAMIGNVVFPVLLETGCLPPFLIIGVVITGCALLAMLLPKTDMKALE